MAAVPRKPLGVIPERAAVAEGELVVRAQKDHALVEADVLCRPVQQQVPLERDRKMKLQRTFTIQHLPDGQCAFPGFSDLSKKYSVLNMHDASFADYLNSAFLVHRVHFYLREYLI